MKEREHANLSLDIYNGVHWDRSCICLLSPLYCHTIYTCTQHTQCTRKKNRAPRIKLTQKEIGKTCDSFCTHANNNVGDLILHLNRCHFQNFAMDQKETM